MRLDTFLLADSAQAAGEKIYVLGGGLSSFSVPEVPYPVSLSVVLRFTRSDDDITKSHSLVVTVAGPEGEPVIPPARVLVQPQQADIGDQAGSENIVQVLISAPVLKIRDLGMHRIQVRLDDELIRDSPLPVVLDDGEA